MRTHPPDGKPPVWAEATLRLFLRPEVFLTVSGDLLEQYRDSILAARGTVRADGWYLNQVLGFVLRAMLPWAAVFAACYVANYAILAADSHTRSAIIPFIAVTLLIAAGFHTAWRSESFLAGVVAGLVMAACASPLSMGGIAVLGGFRRDALIMSLTVIGPAIVIAGVAGLAGAGLRRALN